MSGVASWEWLIFLLVAVGFGLWELRAIRRTIAQRQRERDLPD